MLVGSIVIELSSKANTTAVSNDVPNSQLATVLIHNNSSDSTELQNVSTSSCSVGARLAMAVLLQKHVFESRRL
jgi:4-hydroxy-3-methylbut-2-enyl diphosphate reductase IspH